MAETTPGIDLPAAVIEEFVKVALKTEPGQTILGTLLALNPDLKAAVMAAKGSVKVECQPGRLLPGQPQGEAPA